MSRFARPLPLALYLAATSLLAPLARAVLRGRARRGKEDPSRLHERLGRPSLTRPPGPLVWLHGVSVGESLSLSPLVEALHRDRPDLTLLLTTGTRTAAEVLAGRLPDGVIHQYAPVDTPGAVTGFLDHWRPDTGLLVESELWPNLILQAKSRGVRLGLLSARMTQASADGWRRAPASARALLAAFDLILPQDAGIAARLQSLGATTGPVLNLKLTGAPLDADPAELASLRHAIGERRVILAASTHPGEEALIASACAASDALLIVAPRHPQRGAEVADLLARTGRRVARRTAGQPLTADVDAYVADTLGEMGLFMRTADVAIMGGAFVEGVGGHNPLEAARLGVPVITGPHTFNAKAIYAEMFQRVAALEASDAEALGRDLAGLAAHPHIARRIGEAGLAYAGRQGEALTTTMSLLQPLLPHEA